MSQTYRERIVLQGEHSKNRPQPRLLPVDIAIVAVVVFTVLVAIGVNFMGPIVLIPAGFIVCAVLGFVVGKVTR